MAFEWIALAALALVLIARRNSAIEPNVGFAGTGVALANQQRAAKFKLARDKFNEEYENLPADPYNYQGTLSGALLRTLHGGW